MFSYIRKSIQKLGQDALSKAIYDILKYIIVVLITLFVAKLIPGNSSFGGLINTKFTLSALNLFLIISFCIGITLVITLFQSRKKYKALEKDNFTDELTGIFNHKALDNLLPKSIESAQKQQIKLSLIIIDIDNFKVFNTQYGYKIADKVLTKVGSLLKSDTRATDTLFRQYSKGDEFIIIAKETELSNAIIAANRKKNLFRAGIEVDGQAYRLTVCCGVTEFNFNTDNLDSVLVRLNNALQVAKNRENKNSVEALV